MKGESSSKSRKVQKNNEGNINREGIVVIGKHQKRKFASIVEG